MGWGQAGRGTGGGEGMERVGGIILSWESVFDHRFCWFTGQVGCKVRTSSMIMMKYDIHLNETKA